MNSAFYPGSFDPITNGHVDIVERAASIFPRVIVGVFLHSGKTPHFAAEERLELAAASLAHLDGVELRLFDGLLVDAVRESGANVIVRGLRALSDFEYEVQLAGLNRLMLKDTETIFIPADQRFVYVSASMVRQIAELGGDVTDMVPPPVAQRIMAKKRGG